MNDMDGYKSLAGAVIAQALSDLPEKYRWVKGKDYYKYENFRARTSAIRFFKSGDYLFWVDVCDGDCIKIFKAYKLQVEKILYMRGKEIREVVCEKQDAGGCEKGPGQHRTYDPGDQGYGRIQDAEAIPTFRT
ncbi:hypothetical protein ES705_36412 [subsurface metagenome]